MNGAQAPCMEDHAASGWRRWSIKKCFRRFIQYGGPFKELTLRLNGNPKCPACDSRRNVWLQTYPEPLRYVCMVHRVEILVETRGWKKRWIQRGRP